MMAPGFGTARCVWEASMIDRIAVPLDGTPFGDYALRFACEIARRSGASIRLIHVHVHRHVEHGLFGVATFRHRVMTGTDAYADRRLFEAERDVLEEKASELARRTGLDVSGHIIGGRIGDAVERVAEAWDADLIVMATHARSGLERIRRGSISDQVVRHAKTPVLLVRPPDNELSRPIVTAWRRIIVTLDGSQFSEQALSSAAAMARLFDAKLTLVHVECPPGDRFFVGDLAAEAATAKQYGSTCRQYLEDVVARYGDDLADAEIEPIVGRFPTVGLLEAAVRLDADLICMATHGRGGLSRALVGSTANEILSSTWLPVLVTRPVSAWEELEAEETITASGTA
jgi:nucleotide-binding universal stress UspA family protein